MSDKASKSKTAGPEPTHDDLWRSGRRRFGLQQFRRGRDKKWHFAGQQKDETVRLVVRRHWLFLVIPALPLIGTIVALILAVGASTALQELHALWVLLEIGLVVLFIVTGVWFIYRDFVVWWLETYIVTDKRIIESRGLLEPTRQTAEIEKVTQVGIDIDTLWGFLLSYGTVHVYLRGGDLIMRQVPNPKRVKDAIQGISDEFQAKKPPKQELPVPADPEMDVLLKDLAKGKELPKLENADEHLPPLRNQDKVRGPRRTFGGPLRIPADVHYSSGEDTVMYIQRSRYVLYRNLSLPALLLIMVLSVGFYVPTFVGLSPALIPYWWSSVGLLAFGLLIAMGLIYVNYADDVYILTTRRMIDIERNWIFFYEARVETEYKNIVNIKVLVPNVLERLLDIGNIYVETQGANNPNITLPGVDHPFFLQDKISDIKGYTEKVAGIKKANEAKEELHEWFSKVVTTLERKTQNNGVPNLQELDVLSAMTLASELGLDVVIWGEDFSRSDLPPGRIVHQNPPPGTVMIQGGRIEVVLSKRAM